MFREQIICRHDADGSDRRRRRGRTLQPTAFASLRPDPARRGQHERSCDRWAISADSSQRSLSASSWRRARRPTWPAPFARFPPRADAAAGRAV